MTKDHSPIPAGYPQLLDELKHTVAAARWRAQRVINTELVQMYWTIGHTILTRQEAQGWGSGVVGRLSTDLRQAFPETRGLSRSNLFYMRSFALAWTEDAVVQQPVLGTR